MFKEKNDMTYFISPWTQHMNKVMKAKDIFKHKKKPTGSFPAHLLDGPYGPYLYLPS